MSIYYYEYEFLTDEYKIIDRDLGWITTMPAGSSEWQAQEFANLLNGAYMRGITDHTRQTSTASGGS